ncbi:MAG TPA: glycosyltransferase family 39 protein [Candidatus Paceibacterota bacterium]|nr:glycosyltransferase family 39 protein [Candidatus Paceibacterota bacterium]
MRKILPIAAIVVISGLFMFYAAWNETAIFDETAHIAAGFGYVRHFDYRLNPEHPPLVKALSALPLLFMNLRFPIEADSWQNEVNGQWDMGSRFLYSSGNDPDDIVRAARIFPIIITLITIILIYTWSLELLGRNWAFVPALLFGFSPTVLAHGHYVTTDIGATLGVLISTFTFTKMLTHPTRKMATLSGLALGTALLMKFSNVLLIPFFIVVTAIHCIAAGKFVIPMKRLLLAFVVASTVVYAVYFLFILNYPAERQLSDVSSVLASFEPRALVNLDITLIKNEFLRPFGQYLYGLLMILQRAAGGNTAFFLGDLSAHGWWYYFPAVFLLKEPLPSLIIVLLAAAIALSKFRFRNLRFRSLADYLNVNLAEAAMFLFIIVYWFQSMRSTLNIGIRHLLPTFPFIYILSTGALKSWTANKISFTRIGTAIKTLFKFGIIFTLLAWYAVGTFTASPYFLSYFNEIGGGTKNGYKYVTDSNYDWGQDLKRLKTFVEENNIKKIAVDYFGGGNPKHYLGNTYEGWWSAKGSPKEKDIEWLAVSVNTLQGALAKADPELNRKPEDEYSWLRGMEPVARAGTSIFIYKF